MFDDTKQSLINEYEDQALKGYALYKDYSSEKEYLGLETDRSKILSKIKVLIHLKNIKKCIVKK